VDTVTDGVALSYDTGVLRDGGAGLFGVAAITDAATQALQAAPLDPVMFGLTPGAPAFAAAVAAARAAQARGFRGESDRAQDVAGRAGTAAALGDGLTADTTGIAQGGR
jgi:hypothetical protein